MSGAFDSIGSLASRMVEANQTGQPQPGTTGGKGGASTPAQTPMPEMMVYQNPYMQPMSFNNYGGLVDPTLMAQQSILSNLQAPQQAPALLPSTYQDFYQSPAGNYGYMGNLVVPDYRPMAQTFRPASTSQTGASSGGGGESVGGGFGGLGYDPNAAQTLAPVTTIDPMTGQTVGFSPGGTTASGMPGSTFGIGTVSDDPTGPESEGGNAGDAVGAAGGFAPGISGDTFGGEGDSADSAGGGGGGNKKIICTAMNHAYGFGSFRNAIWIAYADKHLTKAHEVGYHALFLPLVDFGFKRGDGRLNLIVRRVLEWCARHRSTDLRAEMRGGKRDTTGRIIRFIFEPLCYAVGKLKGY